MNALIGCVVFSCGALISELRHRRIEKDRFLRSMERFPGLLDQAAGWRHDALAGLDERNRRDVELQAKVEATRDWVIDLREPPEVQP